MPEIDEPSLAGDRSAAPGDGGALGGDPSARLTADITVVGANGPVPVVSSITTNHLGGPGMPTRSSGRTVLPLPGLTCDDVDDLLEPTAWRDLSGGRLSLRPLDGPDPLAPDGPPRRYRETFLLAPGLVLRPVLTFVRRTLGDSEGEQGRPRGRSLEYRLTTVGDSDGGDLDQSRMVLVDEGSIVVHELPEGLVIRTTKRLRFAPPFDGPAFTLTADLAGYDEANTAMIQAALDRAGDGRAAAAAEIAAAGLATLSAAARPKRPASVADAPPPELTGEQFGTHLVERFVGQGAAATASWWTATAAAWTESFGLAVRGEYSASRLRADGAGAWDRYRDLLSSLVGLSAYAPGPDRGVAASDTSLLVPADQG